MKSKIWALSGGMILLGALAFILQPGPPEPVCAEPGAPYSGAVAEDDPECHITDESYEEIRDYETSPKLLRIAGLFLVVGGVIVGAVGLIRRSRGRSNDDEAAPRTSGG